MRRAAWFVLCSMLVACRSRPHGTPAAPVDVGVRTKVTVKNGSPADLAEILERVTHRHVDWDKDTLLITVCAKVTVQEKDLDTAALVHAVAAAYRRVGLVLEPTSKGWVVHRAPNARKPRRPPLPPQPGPTADPDAKQLWR